MIVFVGDVGIDRYSLADGHQREFWGGCALNAWLAACEQGNGHRLLSIQGTTETTWPQVVLREGQFWPSSRAQLPVQEIELDSQGERHFKHYEAGALSELKLTPYFKELIQNCDLVALPLYAQTRELCLEVLQLIRSGQRKVALDLGVMNDIEDYSFLGPYLDQLYYVQTSGRAWPYQGLNLPIHSVITQGAADTIYQYEQHREFINTIKSAEVIDSTGAGDYFFGSMLSHLLAGKSVAEACRQAGLGARTVVAQLGPNLLK